ncbi:C-C chemokine receptor type 7-like [Chiloscyllium punctatum]|uniref:C-C chemokine receptor type 7-like n=1 Tax=Chiloscyllium punctatum TaxID=137246 RepID=UPI003B634DAD
MTEYEYYNENSTFTYETSVFCGSAKVADFRNVFIPCFYSILFVSGLLRNALVVVIYVYYEKLKTVTDVYMMNLAIADLLFLCTLPFWAVDAYSEWIFGTYMCKLVNGAYTVNLYSCMLILTCVSINRYKAIVQATKMLNIGKNILHSKLVCVGIWVLAMILALPEFILSQVQTDEPNKSVCKMVDSSNLIKVGVKVTQMVVGFLLPFLAMTICYSVIAKTLIQANRFQKHKSLKIIIAVVVAFVICELPFNIVLLMHILPFNGQETSCEDNDNLYYAIIVTESIAYVHCCLNPILYGFLGVKFRNSFLKILKDIGCISQKQLAGLLKTECETSQPVSVVSETTTMYPL